MKRENDLMTNWMHFENFEEMKKICGYHGCGRLGEFWKFGWKKPYGSFLKI